MYTVIVNELQSANMARVSRYFQTKRAAIKWAKWLCTLHYVSMVQVWHEVGGELIAEFHRFPHFPQA